MGVSIIYCTGRLKIFRGEKDNFFESFRVLAPDVSLFKSFCEGEHI